MGLANSTYLLALVGVVLPILIHLWSKRTPKTVLFGSLRFLRESETRTLRSIQPSELLLMSLRIMLIALLVIAMCDPWFLKEAARGEEVLLIDPIYGSREEVLAIRDTASDESTRWLADGFPAIGEVVDEEASNIWRLAESFASLPFHRITVISPRRMEGFQGQARTIRVPIEWKSLPEESSTRRLDTISSQSGGTIVSFGPSQGTSQFQQEATKSAEGRSLLVRVWVKADSPQKELASLMRLSFAAISDNGLLQIHEVSKRDSADWLLWLSTEPAPQTDHLIVSNPLESSLSPIGPNVYQVGTNLGPEGFINQHLPLRLESLFAEGLIDAKQTDLRQVPIEQLSAFSSTLTASAADKERSNWRDLFWVLVLVTLLAERWWSLKTHVS